MRHLPVGILLPVLGLMLLSLPKSYAAHGIAAALAGLTPTQTPSVPMGSGDDVPAQTEGEPIHMPDLLGRSLDDATSLWDEDEPLPQIVVEQIGEGLNLVVVGQTPAAGTLIIPAQTRIVLTLGPGPVTRASPSPTPKPRFSAALAVAGQATLLRAPYVQNLKTTAVTIV